MSKLANQSLTNSLSNSQFLENGKSSDSDRATNENLKESNARTINSPRQKNRGLPQESVQRDREQRQKQSKKQMKTNRISSKC